MPDEVARIGALSNGSNGQRSLESASLHFWEIQRERSAAGGKPNGSSYANPERPEACGMGIGRITMTWSRFAGLSYARLRGSRQPCAPAAAGLNIAAIAS